MTGWPAVGSPPSCQPQPVARGRVHRRRRLCRRSAYRPPSWAAGGLLPRGRVPRRRSGKSRADCRAHRPVYGSWCSVRRASARSPGLRRLFLGAGAMLMGAYNSAVEERMVVVGVCYEVLKTPLPHTSLSPAAEASVHVLPVTEPLRQIAPRHPGPITIEHGRDNLPIVVRGHPDRAFAPGHQVFDPFPLVVAQSEPPHHRSASYKLTAYESKKPPRRNRLPAIRCRLTNNCGNRDSPTHPYRARAAPKGRNG